MAVLAYALDDKKAQALKDIGHGSHGYIGIEKDNRVTQWSRQPRRDWLNPGLPSAGHALHRTSFKLPKDEIRSIVAYVPRFCSILEYDAVQIYGI
ncbi:hypothetical protein PG984_015829 [Apiospora sp. TS-2023a]